MPFQPMPPHHKLQNVRGAPFSTQPTEVVHTVVGTAQPPKPPRRKWYYRYRWLIWIAAFLLWLFVGTKYDVTRVIGCVFLTFWFFAIGLMPHNAVIEAVGNVFDDD